MSLFLHLGLSLLRHLFLCVKVCVRATPHTGTCCLEKGSDGEKAATHMHMTLWVVDRKGANCE